MARVSRLTLRPPRKATPLTFGDKVLLWAFLLALLAGYGALWLYSVGGALFVSGFLCLLLLASLHQKHHERRVAAARPNESICTFSRALDYRNLDPEVVRAVYEELAGRCAFPLRPTDSLANDLGIDDEDLSFDIIPDIAHRTQCSLDNAERNPLYGRVETVSDLVAFFHDQPKVTASLRPS